MKSRFYTAQEVAEMLGVHQSTAYKIIKSIVGCCGRFGKILERKAVRL